MFSKAPQPNSAASQHTATGSFFGKNSNHTPFFQPKLTVNTPGDAYEQQADQVADQVMRMREGDAPIVQRMPLMPVNNVQRKCAGCEKEEQEGVQRKESSSGNSAGKSAPPIVGDVLSSGGGQPMDGGTQQFMESRFGQDFSQVRIHVGDRAAESAEAIQARAYTSGRDVVFGKGEYQPSSDSGKRLLAHELVHVGQQDKINNRINRQEAGAPAAATVPAAAPQQFRDCGRGVTGRDDANEILTRVLNLAIDYVNTAIGVLGAAPQVGTVYSDALNTHFGLNLRDSQRNRILRTYQRILRNLVVDNFICNRNACTRRSTQAMWHPSDDLLHICIPFWSLDDNCRAIVIIHEAAHDAGIDLDDPTTPAEELHTPNRGSSNYPVPGQPRVGRISRTLRMNTPDAYAFFAAHIHNGNDTTTNCFDAPQP